MEDKEMMFIVHIKKGSSQFNFLRELLVSVLRDIVYPDNINILPAIETEALEKSFLKMQCITLWEKVRVGCSDRIALK